MQYLVWRHMNFDRAHLAGGRWLLILCWFSPFLHSPHTHSPPLRVDSRTRAQIHRRPTVQKPSTSLSPCHRWREAGESDPRAFHRQAYWTWQHRLCAERWFIWVEAVGSAPSCGAAFFIANISFWNNTHVSILGHCLQVQTNNSERMGICYQPALSQHSQKQLTEATFLERVRMDNCCKYVKKMLLAARQFTFSKRKVSIWHFL